MAIAIKSVPILKEKAAEKFDSTAKASIAKKSSINFTKQIEVYSKILAKAKL